MEVKKEDVRLDQPWDDKLEAYVADLRNSADMNAKKHDAAGYHFKKRRTWFGLPTTIVPLVMAPVTLVLGSSHPWTLPISAAALLVSGLSSGIYDFFSYGEQTSNNFNCATNWASLVSEIDCEMVKDRHFRQSADVFTARTQMKFDALARIAPILPNPIIASVEKREQEKGERVPLNSVDVRR